MPAQAEARGARGPAASGRFDELGRLAQRMLARHTDAPGAGDAWTGQDGAGARLAEPFPGGAVERGRGLGSGRRRWLPGASRRWPSTCGEWPGRPPSPRSSSWRTARRAWRRRLADPVVRNFREPARETLALFALHPYLNSGGARYVPRPIEETVLVEDFPESDGSPPPSRLLDVLGLDRRRGLARIEIERALLVRAPEVLERDLGLDPTQYQVVCVPSDVYNRAGAERGWGGSPLWTHFDGYQLMRSGHLRALVGGDVRYGGRADLVSIARDDDRRRPAPGASRARRWPAGRQPFRGSPLVSYELQ